MSEESSAKDPVVKGYAGLIISMRQAIHLKQEGRTEEGNRALDEVAGRIDDFRERYGRCIGFTPKVGFMDAANLRYFARGVREANPADLDGWFGLANFIGNP
ncbi:MAG: hypothetical protein AABX28_02060 [Nanoarchaeota archaeon]